MPVGGGQPALPTDGVGAAQGAEVGNADRADATEFQDGAAHLPVAGLLIGFALAHGAAAVLARLARRLIGGQTGDILGAAQQLAEIAIYLGLALSLGWVGG